MSRWAWVTGGLGALFLLALILGPLLSGPLGADNPEYPRWWRTTAETIPFSLALFLQFLIVRRFTKTGG